MELKITQCQVGKFNMLSNKDSLSFGIGLFEDGKIIMVDEVAAVLRYSGEADEIHVFENALDNLEEIFKICFEYAYNLTFSTTNYKAQCLIFAKLYQENYTEINNDLVEKNKITVAKKIEELKKQLERTTIIPDLSYTINDGINTQIKEIKKSITYREKELSQLKEGSEKYNKIKSDIDKYNLKIEDLLKHLIQEAEL